MKIHVADTFLHDSEADHCLLSRILEAEKELLKG